MDKFQVERELNLIKLDSLFYLIILLMAFCIIFELNAMTPRIGEDFALSIPYSMKMVDLPEKGAFIINRIGIQFMTWNSRVGEQLAIVFLAFNKEWFNVLNSICFLVLIGFIMRMSKSLRERYAEIESFSSPVLLVFVFAMIILTCPFWGEVFFWLTGSCNYLWGMILLLLFFLPYWECLHDAYRPSSWYFNIYIFIAGLLAGMTNENTVPVIIVSIVFILVYVNSKCSRATGAAVRKDLWPYLGLIAIIFGYSVLLFSPSTVHRIAVYNEMYGIQEVGLPLYCHRFAEIIKTLMHTCGALIWGIFTAGGFLAYCNRRSFTPLEVRDCMIKGVFYLLSYLSIFSLLFSPYIEKRAFFLVFFTSLLIFIYLWRKLFEYQKARRFLYVIMGVVIVSATIYTCHISEKYAFFYHEALQREEYILAEAGRGAGNISVSEFRTQDTRTLNTRAAWLDNNLLYAKYYGVDCITIKH